MSASDVLAPQPAVQRSMASEAPSPNVRVVPEPSRRAASELAPAELVSAADRPEAVASVVKITIGRLDVRAPAPQPSAAPASPTPEPKRLTLDDYLAQRNGGNR